MIGNQWELPPVVAVVPKNVSETRREPLPISPIPPGTTIIPTPSRTSPVPR